jgi:hypothetical protein
MTKHPYRSASLLTSLVLMGCGEQVEKIGSPPAFDAKAIATEADKGNLRPAAELNKACAEEVASNGRRMDVCEVQDQVGRLAKPLNVPF